MSWTRGGIIGRGSAAAVSLATCCYSGMTFAVKSADVSSSESLQNEARILSTLESPHVVGYRGCDVTREDGGGLLLFNLLLDYAPCGSLSDAIRKWGGLEEAVIAQYAHQILAGIDYLHSRGIVHCDVKPSNVLIGLGNCAKIADFGCAKRVEEATATIGGTPMYMAPEVARGEEQGCPADLWAFGCTVIEMATGQFPWSGVCEPVSAIHKIVYSGKTPEIPSLLSVPARDFLEKCLRRNPKERWTASQLLDHPFLSQVSHGHNFKQVEEFPFSPTSVMDCGIWELAKVTGDVTTWLSESSDSMNERIEKLSCGSELLGSWSSDGDDNGWIEVRVVEEGMTMGESDTSTPNGDRDEEGKEYVNILGSVGIQKKLLGRSCGTCEDSSQLGWRENGRFVNKSDSIQLNVSFL